MKLEQLEVGSLLVWAADKSAVYIYLGNSTFLYFFFDWGDIKITSGNMPDPSWFKRVDCIA